MAMLNNQRVIPTLCVFCWQQEFEKDIRCRKSIGAMSTEQ